MGSHTLSDLINSLVLTFEDTVVAMQVLLADDKDLCPRFFILYLWQELGSKFKESEVNVVEICFIINFIFFFFSLFLTFYLQVIRSRFFLLFLLVSELFRWLFWERQYILESWGGQFDFSCLTWLPIHLLELLASVVAVDYLIQWRTFTLVSPSKLSGPSNFLYTGLQTFATVLSEASEEAGLWFANQTVKFAQVRHDRLFIDSVERSIVLLKLIKKCSRVHRPNILYTYIVSSVALILMMLQLTCIRNVNVGVRRTSWQG